MSSLSDTIHEMVPEALPDLTDLANEVGGAWPKGWYAGEVIEGYTAGSYQFLTADAPSKNGDSRNLRLCFRLTNGAGEQRTTFSSYNYRESDFTPERIEGVKNARKQFAGSRGSWGPQYADLQRSSLALGGLGQVQKALGIGFSFTPAGGINVAPIVGRKADVRLTKNDETGYNEVSGLALAGTKAKG